MLGNSHLESEMSEIADSEKSIMLMLGCCLPQIVLHMLQARGRMLLILYRPCLYPRQKSVPPDEQIILTGWVALTCHVESRQTFIILMGRYYIQYPERWLVGAKSCGGLVFLKFQYLFSFSVATDKWKRKHIWYKKLWSKSLISLWYSLMIQTNIYKVLNCCSQSWVILQKE